MQVHKESSRVSEAEAPQEETSVAVRAATRRKRVPQLEVLSLASAIYESLAKTKKVTRSSIMRVFVQGEAGEAVSRVYEDVRVDDSEFLPKIARLKEQAVSVENILKPYTHKWEDAGVADPGALARVIERVVEPLSNAMLSDLRLSSEPRYNSKFEEAMRYSRGDRSEVKVHITGSALYILAETHSASNAAARYYQIISLERSGAPREFRFACTCPWSSGETYDSRGRRISPEFSSFCKHVLALMIHASPEILAFLDQTEGEGEYATRVKRYRAALEEVSNRLAKELQGLPPREQQVVLSNVAYMITEKAVMRRLRINGYRAAKYILDEQTARELYGSLKVSRTVRVEEDQGYTETLADVDVLLDMIQKDIAVWEAIKSIRSILNRLQGATKDTLYTRALLAAAVLSADLTRPPVFISVFGDPGTGKTLTASRLAELIGVRSLVVRAYIDPSEVAKRLASEAREALEKYKRAAEEVAGPEAAEALEEMFRDLERVVSASGSPPAIPPGFVESYLSRVPEEKRPRAAMVLHTAASHLASLVAKAHDPSSVEAAAREVREAVLRTLERHGVVGSAAEKLEHNGGSVRWWVARRDGGYEVAVEVDSHYLLPLFSYDPERLGRLVEDLSRLGGVSEAVYPGRLAEVKLSRAEDLERMFRARAVDPLDRGKVIWAAGEIPSSTAILADEFYLNRALIQKMQTDLSEAAADKRQTNLVIGTNNLRPLMEAERDPAMQPILSRVKAEVPGSPSPVPSIVDSAVKEVNRLRVEGRLPLVTFDKLLPLYEASKYVDVPEDFVMAADSLYFILAYRIYVARPEAWSPSKGEPLVVIAPRASASSALGQVQGDYAEAPLSSEELAEVRDKRLGRNIIELARVLLVLEPSAIYYKEKANLELSYNEILKDATIMGVMPRVVPAEGDEHTFATKKFEVADAIGGHMLKYIKEDAGKLRPLLYELAALRKPSEEVVRQALEAMTRNPVAAAVFLRFVLQMLNSDKASEFVLRSVVEMPWLHGVIMQLSKYEHVRVV